MIQPTVGFIVYGVHKDGLKDPMGKPFIDAAIIRNSKKALIAAGLRSSRMTSWLPQKKKRKPHSKR